MYNICGWISTNFSHNFLSTFKFENKEKKEWKNTVFWLDIKTSKYYHLNGFNNTISCAVEYTTKHTTKLSFYFVVLFLYYIFLYFIHNNKICIQFCWTLDKEQFVSFSKWILNGNRINDWIFLMIDCVLTG